MWIELRGAGDSAIFINTNCVMSVGKTSDGNAYVKWINGETLNFNEPYGKLRNILTNVNRKEKEICIM